MKNGPITVVGGNIAGISAAFHLAKKGCPVTLYERGVWEKPCGGALSLQFASYLKLALGLSDSLFNKPLREVRIAFKSRQSAILPPLFVTTSRLSLQRALLERLRKEPGIEVIFRNIRTDDLAFLSPQTVLATGHGRLTCQLMKGASHGQGHVLTIKASGTASRDVRLPHLMLFDTRATGYGWFFFEGENRFNIGVGGYIPRKRLREELGRFQRESAALYGYPALGRNLAPRIWKIPVAAQPALNTPSFRRGDVEFVGVGDVLGVAHPVLGAGIEPAWLSGWLLGESYRAAKGGIDVGCYRRLLSKNLALTSRKPIDRVATTLFRVWGGQNFERFVYRFLKLAKKRTLHSFHSYPWFAPARDGRRRTLFP